MIVLDSTVDEGWVSIYPHAEGEIFSDTRADVIQVAYSGKVCINGYWFDSLDEAMAFHEKKWEEIRQGLRKAFEISEEKKAVLNHEKTR